MGFHMLVTGRVQGVGFRVFCQKQALKWNATGWVRNLFDGRVEIFIRAEKNEFEKIKQAIEKGPILSRVDDIGVEEVHSKEVYGSFVIVDDSEDVWVEK